LTETYAQSSQPFRLAGGRDMSDIVTIDSGAIRIWYALNATDIGDWDTYDDLQCLEIGTRLSKYYSHFLVNSDSLFIEWHKKNKNPEGIPIHLGKIGKKTDFWSEYQYSEYFKNFSADELIGYIRMPFALQKSNCYYIEKIPQQERTIEEDTLTVAGYLCQKAVCRFWGRDFTAWFARILQSITDLGSSEGFRA
jgi:GLPGLI family protein